jgi:hypothetical protein
MIKIKVNPQMIREILKGTVAGAVGTVALNVATHADMAIRGRPSSSAPAQLVNTLARFVDLPLPHRMVVRKTRQRRIARAGSVPCSAM